MTLQLKVALLLVPLICVGCGSSDLLPTYPVTGMVMYNGQPVADAAVAFIPEEQGKPSAFGSTGSDGTYTLTTYEAGDGAVEGSYKVTVTKFEASASEQGAAADEGDPNYEPPPDNPRTQAAPKSLIPAKYNQITTSGLTAQVESGDNNFDFELID